MRLDRKTLKSESQNWGSGQSCIGVEKPKPNQLQRKLQYPLQHQVAVAVSLQQLEAAAAAAAAAAESRYSSSNSSSIDSSSSSSSSSRGSITESPLSIGVEYYGGNTKYHKQLFGRRFRFENIEHYIKHPERV